MILSARGIAAGPLPATDADAASGDVSMVAVEGGRRADVLALILAGRMTPSAGSVTLDGSEDPRQLRRRVAIVDSPGTSAPADEIPLADVLAEEFVFAGSRGPRRAARKLLADEDLAHLARTPIGEVPAAVRIRVLARTAAACPEVDALVIVSPERHGGDTASWRDVARGWAARDYAVLVLTSGAAVDATRRSS